jgi:hypothetical protein
MCLYFDLSKKQSDKIIQKAKKRGYIRVWKVCYEKRTGWYRGGRWLKGLRKAKNLRDKDGGWYAYLDKSSAENIRRRYLRVYIPHSIKTCYVKPSWIKRLGLDWYENEVGIFTHLCFPDWDKGDMTIREFREMCRKGK